jgi:hypothetical protein
MIDDTRLETCESHSSGKSIVAACGLVFLTLAWLLSLALRADGDARRSPPAGQLADTPRPSTQPRVAAACVSDCPRAARRLFDGR